VTGIRDCGPYRTCLVKRESALLHQHRSFWDWVCRKIRMTRRRWVVHARGTWRYRWVRCKRCGEPVPQNRTDGFDWQPLFHEQRCAKKWGQIYDNEKARQNHEAACPNPPTLPLPTSGKRFSG